jgi:hypothetical protein
MEADAALYARLTDATPSVPPDPAQAAMRLTEAVQELTSLIRQASGCVIELKLGRRGAIHRLPLLLARAEDAAAEQMRCTGILARALSDGA